MFHAIMRSAYLSVLITLSLIAGMLLVGCDSSNHASSEAETTSEQEEDISQKKVSQQRSVEQVSVQDSEGNLVFEVKFEPNGNLIVKLDKRTIKGKAKNEEKRVYSTDGYDFIEVEASEEGIFKLNTTNGQLLWMVKIYEDKVQISDDEENENPYEIKRTESGKVKVYHQNREIGEAKQSKDVVIVKAGESEVLRIPAKQNSIGYAILGIQQIPFDERYILMAELLARGL